MVLNVTTASGNRLNTYPDREGIETEFRELNAAEHAVEYLPRPRGD